MEQQHKGDKSAADTGDARPLGAETTEIVARGTTVGASRLARPFVPEALAAFLGAMSISFGAVAMAYAGGLGNELGGEPMRRLLGALAFPVGFVILLIGKSELFTENFLLPVLGVWQRRAPLRALFRIWTVSLLFNLLGAGVFAWLIGRPGVLDPEAVADIIAVGQFKLSMGWGEAFVRAIFAGWLMTILTWLLLACSSVGERLAVIWMIATLIVLGRFNHAVISACEVFMAWSVGLTPDVPRFVFGELAPAVLGNLVGGLVFVTALHYLQARGLEMGHARRRERKRHAAAAKRRHVHA